MRARGGRVLGAVGPPPRGSNLGTRPPRSPSAPTLFLAEDEAQQHVAPLPRPAGVLDGHRLPGLERRATAGTVVPVGHRFTVDGERPVPAHVVQARERPPVAEPKTTLGQIEQFDLTGWAKSWRAQAGGYGDAVRAHHPVAAEVGVVALLPNARRRPVLMAQGVQPGQALVDPVPDEAALQSGRGLDGGPVVGQRAVAVADGCVLGTRRGSWAAGRHPVPPRPRCRRSGYIGQTTSVTAAPDPRLGHPAVHDRPLVVEEATRVGTPDPRGRGVMGGAVAGLVAQRPGDDAGVVAVSDETMRTTRSTMAA